MNKMASIIILFTFANTVLLPCMCGIIPGPHLRGFVEYVQSHGGRCDNSTWACTNVDGTHFTMDVISAAMFTQERHKVPVSPQWPIDHEFVAGGDVSPLFSRMEPIRHLKRFPKTIGQLSIKFEIFYYTANSVADNPESEIVDIDDLDPVQGILEEDRKHFYLIHDFADSPATNQMETLREAIDKYYADKNEETGYLVIVIDWSKGAQYNARLAELRRDGVYEMAALNTMVVGYHLGMLIHNVESLEEHAKYVIGVGLGAHVAHFAAEQLKRIYSFKIDNIIGLDPPAHHFQGHERQHVNSNYTVKPYLNAKDADSVTVIHTSAISGLKTTETDLRLGNYGTSFYSGGIDFYPNGGASQPSCITKPTFMCNHNKALEYFVDGLKSNSLESKFISLKAFSYNHYVNTRVLLSLRQSNIGYMSLALAARNPIEPGMYFNHYDGLSNMLDRTPPNGLNVIHQPVTNRTLFRPGVFPAYDFEKVAAPGGRRLLGDDATSDCGLFKIPDGSHQNRIAHGSKSYQGAFPWTVCIYGRSHTNLPMEEQQDGTFDKPDTRHSDVFVVPNSDFDNYVKDPSQYFGEKNLGPFDDSDGGTCTGTIIDNQHIITAGHCFTDMANGEDYILAMGGTSCKTPVKIRRLIIEKRSGAVCSNDPENPDVLSECQRNVFIHPEYSEAIDNDETPEFEIPDVAIIRIPGGPLEFNLPWRRNKPHDTPFLNAICYKSSSSFNSKYDQSQPAQYVYVAGYGRKAEQERDDVKTYSLTWTKQRVGTGYELSNDYFVPLYGSTPGMFYSTDDSIDQVTGKWAGRDVLPGDSGATYFWHVKHALQGLPTYVSSTKAVAIGTVRSGPEEGEHISLELNPQNPNAESITPGQAQKLADLLQFIKDVKEESQQYTSDPPDFIPKLYLKSKFYPTGR